MEQEFIVRPANPCPFCFNEKIKVHTRAKAYHAKMAAKRAGEDTSNYACFCTSCIAKGPLAPTPGEAVALWNRANLPEVLP